MVKCTMKQCCMNKIKEERHKALNVAEELSVHLEGLEILAKLPQEVASLLSLLPTLFDQWVIKSRGLTHTTIPFSCVTFATPLKCACPCKFVLLTVGSFLSIVCFQMRTLLDQWVIKSRGLTHRQEQTDNRLEVSDLFSLTISLNHVSLCDFSPLCIFK